LIQPKAFRARCFLILDFLKFDQIKQITQKYLNKTESGIRNEVATVGKLLNDDALQPCPNLEEFYLNVSLERKKTI
jgi:hypothetical protein